MSDQPGEAVQPSAGEGIGVHVKTVEGNQTAAMEVEEDPETAKLIERMQKLRAIIFWIAAINFIIITLFAILGKVFPMLVVSVLIVLGMVGAWRAHKILLIAYMIFLGLAFIFYIVIMAMIPMLPVIVNSLIILVLLIASFLLTLWLVILIGKLTPEKQTEMKSKFEICHCCCCFD